LILSVSEYNDKERDMEFVNKLIERINNSELDKEIKDNLNHCINESSDKIKLATILDELEIKVNALLELIRNKSNELKHVINDELSSVDLKIRNAEELCQADNILKNIKDSKDDEEMVSSWEETLDKITEQMNDLTGV
jgi:hypothetical protein